MRDDAFIVVRGPVFRSSVWPKEGGYFLDLVRYAAFKDTQVKFKDATIRLARGHCIVTVRFLEKKWEVSRSKAHRLLNRFAKAGLITKEVIKIPGTKDGTDCGTLVTIVNYGDYQLLDERERYRRDASRDADRDIEEGSIKKEVEAAKAPVARDRQNTTGPCGAGTLISEPPPRVAEIIDMHCSITNQGLTWTERDIVAINGLIDALSLANVRGRVQLLAERQMKKGDPPSRLSYYIKAIKEDTAKERQSSSDPRVRAMTAGIGRELP